MWRPTCSIESLRLRSDLLWRIREFFHELGFLEVQTPTLSADTVLDLHIDPISVKSTTVHNADHLDLPPNFFLQTSPEFAMKRLVAAGAEKIFQICPAYRSGERGSSHNPEFTMLEWYRVDDDLEAGTQLLADLIRAAVGAEKVTIETYRTAFERVLGMDPLACEIGQLKQFALDAALVESLNWSEDKDDWLDLIFTAKIQSQLGQDSPYILTHYPASQAALAKLDENDPRVAERFELFMNGIELANGYHELLDASELEARNVKTAASRKLLNKADLPLHSYLLDGMRSGLPACSGCALGIDRLLMAMTKAKAIDDVICFPIERA